MAEQCWHDKEISLRLLSYPLDASTAFRPKDLVESVAFLETSPTTILLEPGDNYILLLDKITKCCVRCHHDSTERYSNEGESRDI